MRKIKMSIIKSGKSNKMQLTTVQIDELQKIYTDAVKGNKAFGFLAPAHYDYNGLKAGFAAGKLYRPLVAKFNLI